MVISLSVLAPSFCVSDCDVPNGHPSSQIVNPMCYEREVSTHLPLESPNYLLVLKKNEKQTNKKIACLLYNSSICWKDKQFKCLQERQIILVYVFSCGCHLRRSLREGSITSTKNIYILLSDISKAYILLCIYIKQSHSLHL